MATYIHFRLVKDDQATGSLVEDAVKDLVEDHLTQSARGFRVESVSPSAHAKGRTRPLSASQDLLDFDIPDGLLDQFGDVSDLDARVRFDDAHQVLLEQGVVQRREVIPDDRVVRQFCLNPKTRLRINLAASRHPGEQVESKRASL